VVGAANRMLAGVEGEVAAAMERRGVVYVPDFVANSGALVFWAALVLERKGERAEEEVRRVGVNARGVMERAKREGRTMWEVARLIAEERLAAE
jgi:valine dehydrogenase (NAD+)